MSLSFQALSLSAEEIDLLRRSILKSRSIRSFQDDPKFSAQIAALGIHQEVGTINDQLADYIFSAASGQRVPKTSIRSEMISYHGYTGVRIWVEGEGRLDLRLRGGRELLHPTFSFHSDGAIKELVIFPESVAKVAKARGIELVIVREWALNTIFGGFDRSKRFYETNAWELVHNDSLLYSGLLERRQVAFLGTHDLAAHVFGLKQEAFDELQVRAANTRKRLESYYGQVKAPSIYSLVLPYAAGVLLDDLAQAGNYGAEGRRIVFEKVMTAIDQRVTNPSDARILMKFPDAYEKLILLARDSNIKKVKEESSGLLQELIKELKRFSVTTDIPATRLGMSALTVS